jgi:phage-related holin
MRKKDGLITVRSVLEKILGKIITESTAYEELLIGLCIICEDLLYNCEECDSFGLKTPQEVIDKIKAILNEWTPF